ncbi:MAG: rhodanese-like domain-containing protein [Desulfomonilaceae bacterium]
MSARKAEKLGYRNVKVFEAGWPAWKKAGRVAVSDVENIESLNRLEATYILLDLRPKAQMVNGHIPQAIAATDGKVNHLKAQLPAFKGAAIILYDQDGDLNAATAPYETITQWGYNQVSILDGGFAAWEKAGKEIARGPAASEIKYVRKLFDGEIEVAEFKGLLAKPSDNKIVLDVRGEAEVEKEGALAGAVNIPLEALEKRLAELPKDKTLVIHGKTGCRAEMAYNLLKKAGLKSQYLKATTEFDEEKKGRFKITE